MIVKSRGFYYNVDIMNLKKVRIPEQTILYIVVPCYNEEETLRSSADKLLKKLDELKNVSKLVGPDCRIIFVDDGSKDDTWSIITSLHEEDPVFSGLSLAHNRGHQNALLAGLMFSKDKADCVISIDADLQQDIDAMDDFLKEYYNGCDVVYGVRNSRSTDSWFKKSSARMFYRFMNLLGADIYENSADYRLLGAAALDALSQYTEVSVFLRGIIPDMGFKSAIVHFDVHEREFGSSKYTLSKMLKLAIDGILSFSIKPIHFICTLGFAFLTLSIIMIIVTLVDYFNGKNIPGYSTLLISLWFIAALQMFAIGIVGEYIGRNYSESKRRPRYYIADICHAKPHSDNEDLLSCR